MKKQRISLYQRDIQYKLPASSTDEYNFIIDHMRSSHTFIFSEYFAFHNKLTTFQDFLDASSEANQWLLNLSHRNEAIGTLIIGGSLIMQRGESFFNTTPVFYQGKRLSQYSKRRLFGHEEKILKPGKRNVIVRHPKTGDKWAILICADVFIPKIFKKLRAADYIAIPTSSPFLPNDKPKQQKRRDRKIFIRGAKKSKSMIFKCCSVGQVGGAAIDGTSAPRIQGRSLICNPKETLSSSPNINWSGILQYETDTTHCNEIPYKPSHE